MKIEFSIDVRKDLIKENNRRGEHWSKAKKRHDTQKLLIRSQMNYYLFEEIPRPCQVTMTRIAPRMMDEDNLIQAFKWIKDELASAIIDEFKEFKAGYCDNDRRIAWKWTQEKGGVRQYAIKISIVPYVPPPPFYPGW